MGQKQAGGRSKSVRACVRPCVRPSAPVRWWAPLITWPFLVWGLKNGGFCALFFGPFKNKISDVCDALQTHKKNEMKSTKNIVKKHGKNTEKYVMYMIHYTQKYIPTSDLRTSDHENM